MTDKSKNQLIIFITLFFTLVASFLYQKYSGDPNGELISNILGGNETLSNMVSVVWDESDVKDVNPSNVILELEYGKIIEAGVYSNDLGIATRYIYFPNWPFPSNQVVECSKLSLKDSITGKDLTNVISFVLTPSNKSLEVLIVPYDGKLF
ncbi:MAG: hypothetical protein WC119_00250 [Synergistaceae bacterium]